MDSRRCYYDHEPAWRRIAARGGSGWGDLREGASGSYEGFEGFLVSTEFQELISSCPGRPRALDLGCGGGQVALRLAERGWEAAGVDFAETAAAIARRNAAERGLAARFLRGDCLALGDLAGMEGMIFDLVIDNHLSHCVLGSEERAALAAGVAARCRPGGLLFTEAMIADAPFDWGRYRVDPATRVDARRTRFFAMAGELEGLWGGAGFAVVAAEVAPARREGEPALWRATLRREAG